MWLSRGKGTNTHLSEAFTHTSRFTSTVAQKHHLHKICVTNQIQQIVKRHTINHQWTDTQLIWSVMIIKIHCGLLFSSNQWTSSTPFQLPHQTHTHTHTHTHTLSVTSSFPWVSLACTERRARWSRKDFFPALCLCPPPRWMFHSNCILVFLFSPHIHAQAGFYTNVLETGKFPIASVKRMKDPTVRQ